MKFFTKRKKNKMLKQLQVNTEFTEKRLHFIQTCESKITDETRPIDTGASDYMYYIQSEYGISGLQVIITTASNSNPPQNKFISLVELERKMFLEKESKNRLRFHIILTVVSVLIAFAALWRN